MKWFVGIIVFISLTFIHQVSFAEYASSDIDICEEGMDAGEVSSAQANACWRVFNEYKTMRQVLTPGMAQAEETNKVCSICNQAIQDADFSNANMSWCKDLFAQYRLMKRLLYYQQVQHN